MPHHHIFSEQFQDKLASYGYVWQFITVAGFHANGLITTMLARDFGGKRKMLAYVDSIQRAEATHKVYYIIIIIIGCCNYCGIYEREYECVNVNVMRT